MQGKRLTEEKIRKNVYDKVVENRLKPNNYFRLNKINQSEGKQTTQSSFIDICSSWHKSGLILQTSDILQNHHMRCSKFLLNVSWTVGKPQPTSMWMISGILFKSPGVKFTLLHISVAQLFPHNSAN